jgi:hypothetical protein
MIDHDHYRRTLLANPYGDDAELLAHRAECAPCREYRERLLAFEEQVHRALNVDIKSGADILSFKAGASRRVWDARRSGGTRSRSLAVAASVTLALAVAGVAWLAAPGRSLAADVVAHMADEPDAWNTHTPVRESELDPILEQVPMRLKPNAPTVTYSSPCLFRGHRVPHLVVQSPDGPVTVMVLSHEAVRVATHFDEQGYRGTIVPMPGHGSLAVLMKTPASTMADVDAVAAQVRSSIVWGR